MRTILLMIIFIAITGLSHAGGPEVQIDKAKIDEVAVDHRGVVLRISGIVKLFVPKVEGESVAGGQATWISLPMKSAEIRYLHGRLNLPSADGFVTYKERIDAMKGTEQTFQMWGAEVTIEGGNVTRISSREVNTLTPLKGERMYSIDRIEELKEQAPKK